MYSSGPELIEPRICNPGISIHFSGIESRDLNENPGVQYDPRNPDQFVIDKC